VPWPELLALLKPHYLKADLAASSRIAANWLLPRSAED
jgi:hypothetical protein